VLPTISPLAFALPIVLAEAAAAGGDAAPQGSPLLQFLPLALIAFAFYFLFIVPQRNKERAMQDMIASLKENDHVVTTGGVHGVVTNIQRDANRLTLRIDDSNGTRVRVALWAIDSVISDKPTEAASKT
jgi:preprotein translocase subunit YajC